MLPQLLKMIGYSIGSVSYGNTLLTVIWLLYRLQLPCCNTDVDYKRSLKEVNRAHATQMIRCRSDTILESQDFFTSLGETFPSSSRHLLSHNSTEQFTIP